MTFRVINITIDGNGVDLGRIDPNGKSMATIAINTRGKNVQAVTDNKGNTWVRGEKDGTFEEWHLLNPEPRK